MLNAKRSSPHQNSRSTENANPISTNTASSIVRSNKGIDNKQSRKPTLEVYGEGQQVYEYLNKRLFGSQLPNCIITLTRHSGTLGYFSGDIFENQKGELTHEISLNPAYFRERGDADTLSTLAHEMCHLWRHVLGPPNRSGGKGASGYHDLVWVGKMEDIGLLPTATGLPGGKKIGYSVTHLIIEGGPFDLACRELLISGFRFNWRDRKRKRNKAGGSGGESPTGATTSKKKDREKFTCKKCGLNAWAKPAARLICGKCKLPMATANQPSKEKFK